MRRTAPSVSLLALSLTLILWPSHGVAQDAASTTDEATSLDTVVVTGTPKGRSQKDAPFAISVLSETALDRAAQRVLAGIETLADEAQARRLARDIALLVQAALLQRGSAAVFSAFCASRLDGAADVFGLLPAGTDFDAILKRAMPTLQ